MLGTNLGVRLRNFKIVGAAAQGSDIFEDVGHQGLQGFFVDLIVLVVGLVHNFHWVSLVVNGHEITHVHEPKVLAVLKPFIFPEVLLLDYEFEHEVGRVALVVPDGWQTIWIIKDQVGCNNLSENEEWRFLDLSSEQRLANNFKERSIRRIVPLHNIRVQEYLGSSDCDSI